MRWDEYGGDIPSLSTNCDLLVEACRVICGHCSDGRELLSQEVLDQWPSSYLIPFAFEAFMIGGPLSS